MNLYPQHQSISLSEPLCTLSTSLSSPVVLFLSCPETRYEADPLPTCEDESGTLLSSQILIHATGHTAKRTYKIIGYNNGNNNYFTPPFGLRYDLASGQFIHRISNWQANTFTPEDWRHCPFLSLIRKCPIPVGSDFACQVLLASVTDPHSESLMSHFRLIVEDPARSEPLVSPSFRLPTSLKFARTSISQRPSDRKSSNYRRKINGKEVHSFHGYI
ncbi:hypothetical protein RRG08_009691 [Elysia crispata]|uniref:Uncharacterized protein n=1 Tax=Elysia crispata TaxID=231223 RepID=A0AAE0XWQ5_9GAST|nr:hypothetical protein RRG08_009691 [Elysia crispata]